MFVCAQVVGQSAWQFFKYVFNDLDYIFGLYLSLEGSISFRRSYLIVFLIYTGINFYFICFLKPV